MDNVLANFSKDKGMELALEQMYEQGFFLNLKPFMTDVPKQLMEMGHQVFILSAYVDTPYCRKEKKLWVAKHHPNIPATNIILIRAGRNKADYADVQGNILIDDYGKNLEEWRDGGGIPVKFSNSAKERDIHTIRSHDEIFAVLEQIERGIWFPVQRNYA
jgi:5'(3')-deoxyribonucleotidase